MQVPIVFSITGTTMNTNGTESRSIGFGGLSIANGTAGNINFCGGALAIGPNWRGVTETDTTNNTDCESVAYDPNGGSIGLVENVIYSEGSIPVLDGSYSDGKTFYVNVYNMNQAQAEISFVDLTGRTIYSRTFQANGKEVHGEISLNDMPKGVLLAVLSVGNQQVNAKKIVVE